MGEQDLATGVSDHGACGCDGWAVRDPVRGLKSVPLLGSRVMRVVSGSPSGSVPSSVMATSASSAVGIGPTALAKGAKLSGMTVMVMVAEAIPPLPSLMVY